MTKEFKNPVKLQQRCIVCGGLYKVTVEREDIEKLNKGTLVQDAFPYLTAGERELFFMSHICDSCWDDMFKEENIEDD